MLELKPRQHGFVVILSDTVNLDEIKKLQFQLSDEMAGLDEQFVLVLDIRRFRYFTADAQAALEQLIEEWSKQKLAKISVVGISTAFASLFCNLMVRADAMSLYQYLDIAYEDDWKAEMTSWLNEPFAEKMS